MEEDDFVIKNLNELTTYEYVSNGYFFEYFVGFEIAALIGYKNTNDVIIKNVSKCNQLVFREYPGVKEPEIDPRTILITRDGAIEILIKTRKRISPDVLHILKKFNIDTTNRKCLTKEQQTLSAITNTFKTEKFEDQYKIGSYYLDLYFPEYKIVVECDENGHADRKPYKERDRMNYVNEKLEIEDDNWIRYNPDEYDFDITKVIGKIYRKIDEIKEEKYKKLLDETKKEDKKLQKKDKIIKLNNIDKIHECHICETKFILKSNLQFHMKKDHDLNLEISEKCISILLNDDETYDININEDNMINCTLLCNKTTKHFHNYRRLVNTRQEIKKISKKFKIPENILLTSSNNVAWIHIYLLPHFSLWLSHNINIQVLEYLDTLKILDNLPVYIPDYIFTLKLISGENLYVYVKKNNFININDLCRLSGKLVSTWKKQNLQLLKQYENPILEYSGGLFAHPNIAILIAKWCNIDYEFPFLEILKSNPLFNLEVYNTYKIRNKNIQENIEIKTININSDKNTSIDMNNNTTECSICIKIFPTKSKLKRHYDSVHKKIKHKCELCDAYLNTKDSLKNHISTVHEKKNIKKCDMCDKTYINKTSLQLHIESFHKKITNAECHICNKIFITKYILQTHINKIHNKIKVKCTLCSKILEEDNLKYHMYSFHKI